MNLRSSLQLRNITLAQWPFASDLQTMRWGTCGGLAMIDDSTVMIIAIANESPGNGDFKDLIVLIEQAAKENKAKVEFVAMQNRVFARTLNEKHGYEILFGDEKGLYVRKDFGDPKPDAKKL